MPIKRSVFESGKFQTRHDDRDAHPVAVLLRKNSHLAFTVKEIVKKTGMKEDSIRSMLRNLKIEGKIVHKQPYLAWKEVQRRNRPKRRK